MSAVAWSTVEDAIHDWVLLGSGLAAGQIIWGGERAPRPASTTQPASTPYIELMLDVVRSPGLPWVVRETIPAAPPLHPKDRLQVRRRNHAIARLQLQCFAPDRTSMRVLHDVVSTDTAALDELGVGLGEIGEVKLLPGLRSGLFEPRSIVEIQLHLSAELVQIYDDYIERIQLTVEVDDANGDPLVEAEEWIPDRPPPADLVGFGALAAGITDQAPAWPAGHVAGDWGYLLTQSDIAIAAPAGWTELANVPVVGSVHQLFERDAPATGGAEVAPTVEIDTADHLACRIFAVRGVNSENRIEAIATADVGALPDTAIVWPSVETLDPNRLIVGSVSWDIDDAGPLLSGYSNATLESGPDEEVDQGTLAGFGGGIAAWSGVAAEPGEIGPTLATSAQAIMWSAITIAFRST